MISSRQRLRRQPLRGLGIVAALLVAAACTPDPPVEPAHPVWTPTVVGWSAVPGAEAEVPLAATTEDWFVAIEQRPGIGTAATSSTLLIYPRTGVDGAPAATPSQTITVPNGVAGLAMSDHVIAVRARNYLAALDQIHLFGLDSATATWSQSTLVPRGLDNNRITTFVVSDTALVLGDTRTGQAGDGSALVIPLTVSGASISWSFSTVVPLSPDAGWQVNDRAGFGRTVAVAADWVAISGGSDHVVVYRRDGASWTPDLTLLRPSWAGTDGRFGKSLALDIAADGRPRLLVGTSGGFTGFGVPGPGRAELYSAGPSGWSLSQSIMPRPGSALDGFAVGNAVALDGDRAVVGLYWARVPRPDAVLVDDYRLEVWDVGGATPVFEAELSALTAVGGPRPGQSSSSPASVGLAGSHVVIVGWEGYAGAPSHFSAISFDRHPAS